MSTTERIVSRSWSAHEDNLLKQAVSIHGENDNWKTIALSVPGRTNKACRKRWLHSLSPTIKKSAWTTEEDRLLIGLRAIHSKWSIIARHIPGRTDDACSKRYREALDPSLKKDEWSAEEDDRLLAAYVRLGGKWGQVGQELSRSGLGCRNRWRLLQRKRLATASKLDQFPPTEDSTQNIWDIPVLDVAQYWNEHEHHSQYNTNSTPVLGHLPHTQDTNPARPESGPELFPAPSMPDPTAYIPPFAFTSYSLGTALSALRGTHTSSVDHRHSAIVTSSIDSECNGQANTLSPTSFSSNTSLSHLDDSQYHSVDDNIEGSYNGFTLSSEQHCPTNAVRVVPNSACETRTSCHQENLAPIESETLAPSHILLQTDVLDIPPTPALNNLLPPPPLSSEIPQSPTAIPPNAPSSHRSNSYSPYYRPSAGDGPRVSASKRRTNTEIPRRLNADLSVTSDPAVLPYACGHQQCWSTDHAVMTSLASFATSRELNDHCKSAHSDNTPGDGRLFRCGLNGCGKSWKSINGLQYHLQISKAHFQQALSSAKLSLVDKSHGPPAPHVVNPPSGIQPAVKPKSKKVHSCPHPGCSNEYKQLSGLRYHLAHGHPEPHDLPLQLDAVPPALAKKVSEKLLARGSSSISTARM